ncbi:neck protein [Nitrososphaeria virus YSH_922147]|uniref:Neck protein n=1 Tax=Nitrososphaeria virus YSH_922147 TaxID=3071323 RepID=A0A976UAS5_9CAUD|nr:neck protein [Yangshan Harbor Nitrososphaeria virus]UVF62447.1 neck protein [Nitrososphaeria virus YSH_922147]
MEFDFEIKGIKDNDELLNYIKENIDEYSNEMLKLLGESIIAEARSNLQNNTNINSGSLLASIRILDEDDNTIIIGSDLDYAGYIEYGRGPIHPKDPDGWLHWIDKSTGKDVFAKFAKATEPMPFMEPAIISQTSKFPDVFILNFIEELKKL